MVSFISVFQGQAIYYSDKWISCHTMERVCLMYQVRALTAWILYNNIFDCIKTFHNYHISAHTAVYVRMFSGSYFLRGMSPYSPANKSV